MKHVRYIRCEYIVGWEPCKNGLLLMYSTGARELIEMKEEEADENSEFFLREMFNYSRDVIAIAWDDDK